MPSVQDFMSHEVVKVNVDDSALHATKKIVQAGYGATIVMRDDEPIGIITETDLLEKVLLARKDPEKVLAAEIMSSPLISVEPDTSIRDATKLMLERNIRRLVVIKDRKLVGLITNRGITTSIVGAIGEKETARVTRM